MTGTGDAPSRQTRKRLATRQSISDAATKLFFKHGFDNVTVEDIAEAADVSRMTVFNHFARKEDMFFDLDDAACRAMVAALESKADSVSAVEAFRLFVHKAVMTGQPFANILAPESYRFMATVRGSEALKARARAIRDELSDDLSHALAHCVHRPGSDPDAALAASLLVATLTVALDQAHHAFDGKRNTAQAKRTFCKLLARGTRGVAAALAGTPYV